MDLGQGQAGDTEEKAHDLSPERRLAEHAFDDIKTIRPPRAAGRAFGRLVVHVGQAVGALHGASSGHAWS